MSVTPRTDEVSRTITLSAHGPVETATHNARSLRWMREHAETLECELAQAQGEIVRLDGRDIAEWRDHAAALGRALSEVPTWIPVGERLPDPNGGSEEYLIVSKTGYRTTLEYGEDGWRSVEGTSGTDYWNGFVTHWMPLPGAPK